MLNRLARLRRAAARLRPARSAAADREQAFLLVARQSFVQLQAAWDRADLPALGLMTTAPLLDELRQQLLLRGPGPNQTEVLELKARLVTIEDMRDASVASVEFTGWIREQADDQAAPFRELWLLADVKSAGCGWKLARVQSLS